MRSIFLLSIFILCLFNQLQADSQALENAPITDATSRQVHGLLDISIKNDYMTPRGLLVTNTGVTFQVLGLLFFDFYENPDCWLQKATVTTGVWNDIWSEQGDYYVGAWNELDWSAGFIFELAHHWTFGAQFLAFLSPPHNFRTENNLEFLLSYDDSSWEWPIVWHPYAKLFWTMSGDSTVVTGETGTFDVELGMIPTYTLETLTLSAPSWLTVGPSNFWAGGQLALPDRNSNWGILSTGLKAELPIKWILPGNWSTYIGGQYYHLINDNLLQAQTFTLGVTLNETHRDVGVAYAGLLVKF